MKKPKQKKGVLDRLNDAFLALHKETRTIDVMEQMVEQFFQPLAEGYWLKKCSHFRRLDKTAAIQDAVVACFLKVENYDPAKGTPANYFTRIIEWHLQGLSKKEAQYYERNQPLERPANAFQAD